MEAKQKLMCDRCQVELELLEAQFSYLGRTFQNKVERCPSCGQVYIPEDLVVTRISKVEEALEDK